jgi:2-amino-4-hydroxy-6-hydroxymethyldihydropteridine diphosphokinase
MIDKLVVDSEKLTIPHPQMHNRRFALLPLAEIAPTLYHPIMGLTVAELLDTCPDILDVQKK